MVTVVGWFVGVSVLIVDDDGKDSVRVCGLRRTLCTNRNAGPEVINLWALHALFVGPESDADEVFILEGCLAAHLAIPVAERV